MNMVFEDRNSLEWLRVDVGAISNIDLVRHALIHLAGTILEQEGGVVPRHTRSLRQIEAMIVAKRQEKEGISSAQIKTTTPDDNKLSRD